MDGKGRNGRALLAAAAAGALVAWAGVPEAAAQQMTKIKVTQPADSLSYMSIYVARAKKYFEQEGIDLEVIITQGDGPDVQALLAKEVDFVATPPHHLYSLYNQGKPLLGVAGLLGRLSINMVIHKEAAKARGITEASPLPEKLKALKGLTIGASRAGTLTYNVAIHYIKRAGYEPQKDVKVIGAGTGAAAIAALENRLVDAYAFSSPLVEQMVSRGNAIWFLNNTAGQDPEMAEFLHAVLYVRPDYAREKPETVRKMVRAIVRASNWIVQSSPEEVAEAIRPFFTRLEPAIYLSAVRNVKQAVAPDGRMSEAGSDNYQKLLLETGGLKAKVPYGGVFTTEYLPPPGTK